jgi:FKBP-type peptidyl-prolyl cis-trans isomerase
MTKNSLSFLSISLLALLGACTSPGFEKTPSGIMYKIVSSGSGPLVKYGQVLKFHFAQKLNDSVLYSSYNAVPVYQKVDSVGPVFDPREVFPFLHKGDSVQIVQLADSILAKMPPGQQSILKKGDKITAYLKVVDIISNDQLVQADLTREMAKETSREDADIRSYLAKKNINAQKTPKGVYVAVQNPGTGTAVDSGKFVTVFYTGRLFENKDRKTEKVFETNVGKEPITFQLSTGQVIPGWDEGLKMLKPGGKGTLYIPSTLAYAQQPVPGGGAFENLIFDVEVVNVSDSQPKQRAIPGMPPQGPPPTGR